VKYIILGITLISIALLAVTPSSWADDVKMFNHYTLKHKLNDTFDIFVQPDTRFNDNISRFNYYHVRTGVIMHVDKNLDLGTTYRFLEKKSSSGEWLYENRIELDCTPKMKIEGFNLANRSRFEYRNLEKSKNKWRYRNKSKISHNAAIGNFTFTPYISEEIFYDFDTKQIHLNWAAIGADKKLSSGLSVGLYYLNETTRVGTTSEWDTNHIFGTKVTISF